MSTLEILIASMVAVGVAAGLYVVGRMVWTVISFRLHPERFVDEDDPGSRPNDPAPKVPHGRPDDE